jgi:hypothetical protein
MFTLAPHASTAETNRRSSLLIVPRDLLSVIASCSTFSTATNPRKL